MNDYISYMANKKKSKKTRLYYKTKALRLFAGGGDCYEENGVQKKVFKWKLLLSTARLNLVD